MKSDAASRRAALEMSTPPRILSLSTVFPRPDEPRFGLFVARRLEHLARLAPVEAVVPVPWLETSGPRPQVPRLHGQRTAQRGPLTVHYRRWAYPPGLGAVHPAWMAAQLLPFLRRLRARFAFDLIDAHFGFPEGVAALRLARRLDVPFTVTLRGNEPAHAGSAPKRARMAAALQRAAAVIAVSGPLREFAVSLGAAPDRCVVIGNGVDTEVFRPRPRDQARAKLGMSPERVHLLSAGYLIPRKGHHRLAALLPELWKAGFPADLWIVGGPGREGDAKPALERIIASARLEPHVHIVPPVAPEELAEYMSACDLFCLASSREGWPNVVHEAMACGAPVVATRVGAVEEMVPGRECGILVAPGDDRALLEGLLQALRIRFDRGGIARRAAARGWDRVAQEVLDLFETVVKKNVSRSGA